MGRGAPGAARAAAATAWAAWPQPTVGHAAVSQFGVVATVALLAVLPLLARRFLGPASPSRAGRVLRVFCCAALLAFLPALAIGTGTGLLLGVVMYLVAPLGLNNYAGANVFGYVLIWISFPVIGLIVGAAVASVFADSAPPEASPAAVQEP